MLCSRCGALQAPYASDLLAPVRGGGPGEARCPQCGAAVVATDPWPALLETLTQLARFGLDSEGPTLLEPVSEDT